MNHPCKHVPHPAAVLVSPRTSCFDRVNETHRPLIVTRKGRADAVLVSAADFDPLMDVFLLADTVRKSRKEIAEGRGIDHKTAMRQFRERHGI